LPFCMGAPRQAGDLVDVARKLYRAITPAS
jgi:hypothetical protein